MARRSTQAGAPGAPPYLAVALLSAGALGYEILLMRLFSIIQWHHFAYMLISVALLGYGAAGSFVAIARQRLLPHFGAVFASSASLFGITAVAGFALAQRVSFNPLEILWDVRQPLLLLLVYLLLTPPFFFVATALCLAFARFGTQSHRLYSADVLGAGLGSIGILAALYLLMPADALRLIGAVGLTAAGVSAWADGAGSRRRAAALLIAAAIIPPMLPPGLVQLIPSEYKDLSQALRVHGAALTHERSSPLGLLSVVDSPLVPLRHAPGLSLNATMEPPPQLAVFSDGDGPSALTRFDGTTAPLAYLDYLTSALPYHLLPRPRVLVLGAGTGADVLQALFHGARSVDAVELNPQLIDLAENRYGGFAGRPYAAPGVRVHLAEARGFIAGSRERYQLIQVALLDAFSASSAGLYALSENYTYTTEALQDYLRHLEPGGLLAITRWMTLPPRDTLKLFATAVRALQANGVAHPDLQLVLIRGWKTVTLLLKNGAFAADDLAAIKEFCRLRSFDTEYYPGITAGEANRYNVVGQPDFSAGALALLGPGRDEFIARYKFNIAPASDDRPHFFHFFKWRTLPELLTLRERGAMPPLDWGYPVLIATLLQAVVVAVALILLPLAFLQRERDAAAIARGLRGRVAWYFLGLGFGFMFIEIAFIQKFILFLSNPLYAVAVVLCSFLIFAGLGGRVSGRLQSTGPQPPRALPWLFAYIGLVALAYLALLPPLFHELIALPDLVKIALSVALIAPLAFGMGMPFPLGLASVAGRAEMLLPWAWGINGFASVVAAILASVLAIHLGFNAVVLLAVLFYGAAAFAFPR